MKLRVHTFAFSFLLGLPLSLPASQSPGHALALQELRSLEGALVIDALGTPLTLNSLRGKPGLLLNSNGAAPSGATASGIVVDVNALSTLGYTAASAQGMLINCDATSGGDALATGMVVNVTTSGGGPVPLNQANGILVDVYADTPTFPPARGVYVQVRGDVNGVAGVEGRVDRGTGLRGLGYVGVEGRGDIAVFGIASEGRLTDPIGVLGDGGSLGANGVGVMGLGLRGIVGMGDVGVDCQGDLNVTGNKNFLQPHPTDPSRVIAFVCLEGNESGTYFRGSTRLTAGRVEIAIPEEWALVTADEGITVQLTSVGSAATLYVAEQTRTRIVVRGEPDCAFNYFVNGVRRGFLDYDPFRENRSFRPEVKGVPFGEQYSDALLEILVENGTLNPDHTPNEFTAAALGWALRDPATTRIDRRTWLDRAERKRLWNERTPPPKRDVAPERR